MSSESSIKLLIYSFIGLVSGVILFFSGLREFREKQMIENTPTSKIRSLAMGFVEVCGKVKKRRKEYFTAPISGEKCIWCKWLIEEERGGKHRYWDEVKQETLQDYFWLDDDTGKVIVDPKDAQVEFKCDLQDKGGYWMGELSPNAQSFLESKGFSLKDFFGIRKRYRVSEWYLQEGDSIYILGDAVLNPLEKGGNPELNEQNIMIKKARKKTHFFISDSNEKDLLNMYSGWLYAHIFGGALLTLACLAYIFSFFKIL